MYSTPAGTVRVCDDPVYVNDCEVPPLVEQVNAHDCPMTRAKTTSRSSAVGSVFDIWSRYGAKSY
jgi:hypothetical protein